ncbi:MAG: hypothetical protein KJ061_12560 [Vicinamibacteraceae bacterium]|nr:hypothetical protein [Vicinamibacteraceae bacterium]
MDVQTFTHRLKTAPVVVLRAGEWAALEERLDVVERHDTFVKGDLLVFRTSEGLGVVEAPSDGERVARLMGDADSVRAFVSDRLETYERMWNGCGCRIDYYR